MIHKSILRLSALLAITFLLYTPTGASISEVSHSQNLDNLGVEGVYLANDLLEDPIINVNDNKNTVDLVNSLNLQEDRFLISPSITSHTFVSQWNTTLISSESSNNLQVKLPLESSGTYNFDVDWGDGNVNTITSWDQDEVTHTYASEAVYTITIDGALVG